jgi:hypothetical protein
MQRIFEVLFNGKTLSFKLTKISRSKLYGSKRRIPIDAQGQECKRAALTSDGMYVLPNGGIAMLYLDTQGDVVERNRLQGIDEEGEVAENPLSVAVLEVVQIVTATEILDCSITHAYTFEPVFICTELEESLSEGTIYRLPDCYDHRRFLIGNREGCFMLVGKRTGFEFVGLAEADLLPPDFEAEDMDEELDFTLL